jgi:hypothetical protein
MSDTPPETETISQWHIQMDDLVTGQLGMWKTWRLRRRIACNPALAREFAEFQQLHSDLQQLAWQHQFPAPRFTPLTSPATWTIGGITMKRRAVLIATAALTCLTITGAVAARRYLDLTPSSSFTDKDHKTWEIRTHLPGTICVFTASGQPLGRYTSSGGFPKGSDIVLLTYAGKAKYTLHGYGTHVIKDEAGKVRGRVEVAPLSEKDIKEQRTIAEVTRRGQEAMYREPNAFTNDLAASMSTDFVTSAFGLSGGYNSSRGVSWKMLGYANITAEYLPKHSKVEMNIQRGMGKLVPTIDTIPPALRPGFMKRTEQAPPPGTAPKVYWQIAGDDHKIVNGAWRDLKRSGEFTGYGKHIVKDEAGNPVLVLTVSLLTPDKTNKTER